MRLSLSGGILMGLIVLCSVVVIVNLNDKVDSLEGRVELLEKQIHQKLRPIVAKNIQSATIFNSDGEIVIETRGEEYVE